MAEYERMKGEPALLRILVEAEEDMAHGRVAPAQETFDSIRQRLLARKDG